MGKDPNEIRREIEHTRDDMSQTVDALAYKLDVKERTKDKVHNIVAKPKRMLFGAKETTMHAVTDHVPSKQSISSAASDARDTVTDKASAAAHTTVDAAHSAADTVKQSPSGLIIGGLALGLLAGWALPRTSLENRKLGSHSDDVREKAVETGREVLEHGKEVASEAMVVAVDAAKDAAEQTTQVVKEATAEHTTELQESTQEKVDEVRGVETDPQTTTVINAPPVH